MGIFKPTDFTIGIIGGGQLAKMTGVEARKLGLNVVVLDPSSDAPASMVSNHIVAKVDDPEGLKKLNQLSDVITYEIEHIDTQNLKTYLDTDKVFPSIQTLEIIQDKYRQRKFFKSKGIPVPNFWEVDDVSEIANFIPCVQKAKVGGYDGRGVVIIKSKEDLNKVINTPSYIEEYVDVQQELGIIVARDKNKNIKVYPVSQMVFNPDGNLLDYLKVPADIDEDTYKEAQNIAISAIEALDGVGVFGVELFLDSKGRILLNEVAPRTHNSGHYTIEACETSQFEQLVRILSGLPMGSTYQYIPAITLNLLGEPGYRGKPIYENLDKVMEIDGVYVHIYGKKNTFPLRKMGHITILDFNKERLLQKMTKVKTLLKVKGDIKDDSHNNG
ncbi:MAG: 5-(carboxyamino)imidazole ribonucleotide synthase [Hydrogenothermaceae bacterium]|nr:5-(carboxyamino)imidazole ribonucleotide synthase [Hydrogenothermaceae bacterium]